LFETFSLEKGDPIASSHPCYALFTELVGKLRHFGKLCNVYLMYYRIVERETTISLFGLVNLVICFWLYFDYFKSIVTESVYFYNLADLSLYSIFDLPIGSMYGMFTYIWLICL